MSTELILIFLLILLSGLFSGTESAIFSLDYSSLAKLNKTNNTKKRRKLKRLTQILHKPEKTLSAILFGNLMINIALTDFANQWLELQLGSVNNFSLISLIVITLTLLIFAEILPKVLALAVNVQWSLKSIPILKSWIWFSNILAKPINIFVETLVSFLPNMKTRYSEVEIIDSLRIAENHGLLSPHEKSTLNRYVSFHHDTAFSAMVPRSKIFMISHDSSIAKVRKHFQQNRLESSIDLILIYHNKDNKIIGYLNLKHIVLMHFKKQKSLAQKSIEVLHVPETMPLREVLNTFIDNKKEVAVVLSEDGELSGVITLNIVLQKLIGDFNENEPLQDQLSDNEIKRISNNGFTLNGALLIVDFNEFFHSNFTSETSETISGLLLEQLDGFPQIDTSITMGKFTFDRFKMKENRILNVRVTEMKAKK